MKGVCCVMLQQNVVKISCLDFKINPHRTLSVNFREKMGYTVGTEVPMDRDVGFLKTMYCCLKSF